MEGVTEVEGGGEGDVGIEGNAEGIVALFGEGRDGGIEGGVGGRWGTAEEFVGEVGEFLDEARASGGWGKGGGKGGGDDRLVAGEVWGGGEREGKSEGIDFDEKLWPSGEWGGAEVEGFGGGGEVEESMEERKVEGGEVWGEGVIDGLGDGGEEEEGFGDGEGVASAEEFE